MYNDPNTEKVVERFDRNRERYLERKETGGNGHGYSDPTAYSAMKQYGGEEYRFYKLLYTIFYIVKLAGFELDGRIRLVDKKTGRVWE